MNEAFALRYFPGQDALGKQVRFEPPNSEGEVVATVVGVVPALGRPVSGRDTDAMYIPITMSLPGDAYVMLRSAPGQDPLLLLPELQTALATLDPDKPLHSIGSIESLIRREGAVLYAIGGLFVVTGLAALLMAGTGLYAVMAFSVGRRTREVGVRVALGATPAQVVWAMLRQASFQLAQGLFLGLVLAVAMAPVFLGGDALRTDPRPYALVTAVLLGIGLVAAVVPALRAVRVEPTVALRAE